MKGLLVRIGIKDAKAFGGRGSEAARVLVEPN
jgi:hypothetical protein